MKWLVVLALLGCQNETCLQRECAKTGYPIPHSSATPHITVCCRAGGECVTWQTPGCYWQ